MSAISIRETVANLIYPEQAIERRNLTRLANLDPLTGLANRRAFELALPAAELDPDTAVVLFDANNFGDLNKAAGHKFGDVILKEMADVIIRAARAYKVAERAFRIGGDEFVLIIDRKWSTRIRDQVESRFGVKFPGIEISLSGAVGDTFAAADAQIQQRKRERKNVTN